MGLRASLLGAALVSFCQAALAQSPDEKALIALARSAVEAEVLHHKPLPVPDRTPSRPVFVTIEVGGAVVGCRGGLVTRSGSLEAEVVLAARAAAAHDPRYRPLRATDLKSFQVTVTVVDRTEPMTAVDGLAPADGLVLKAGSKTGVVLPWEGKDPQTRLKWAYRKAGVPEGSPASLLRLIATRFRG